MKFKVGDFVYFSPNEIGRITHIGNENKDNISYQIDYCQGKDLDSGCRGGNGPIFREGFPKQITEPADVLFVRAMKEKLLIEKLSRELKQAEANFNALKRARELVTAVESNQPCSE